MFHWLARLFGFSEEPQRASKQADSRRAIVDTGLTDPLDSGLTDQPNPHSSESGFNESLAVGYLANDALLGGIVGGNLLGGMIGDLLNASEEQPAQPQAQHHSHSAEFDPVSNWDSIESSHSSDHGPSDHDSGPSDSGSDASSE